MRAVLGMADRTDHHPHAAITDDLSSVVELLAGGGAQLLGDPAQRLEAPLDLRAARRVTLDDGASVGFPGSELEGPRAHRVTDRIVLLAGGKIHRACCMVPLRQPLLMITQIVISSGKMG